MKTHVPEVQLFSSFLHHFVLVKLATSSIRVNPSDAEATFVKGTITQKMLKVF